MDAVTKSEVWFWIVVGLAAIYAISLAFFAYEMRRAPLIGDERRPYVAVFIDGPAVDQRIALTNDRPPATWRWEAPAGDPATSVVTYELAEVVESTRVAVYQEGSSE